MYYSNAAMAGFLDFSQVLETEDGAVALKITLKETPRPDHQRCKDACPEWLRSGGEDDKFHGGCQYHHTQ